MTKRSIALIGMAGVGKTHFGKLLAEELKCDFIDTDTLLEIQMKCTLHEFSKTNSVEKMMQIEENALLSLSPNHPTIIATGGSAVYSEKGMRHLQEIARIIWLKDSLKKIKSRIPNLSTRGLINPKNQSFKNLYIDRQELYLTYADHIIEFPQKFNAKIILEKIKEVICNSNKP